MKPPKNFRKIKRRSCSNCKMFRSHGDGFWWCHRSGPDGDVGYDWGDWGPEEFICDRYLKGEGEELEP